MRADQLANKARLCSEAADTSKQTCIAREKITAHSLALIAEINSILLKQDSNGPPSHHSVEICDADAAQDPDEGILD